MNKTTFTADPVDVLVLVRQALKKARRANDAELEEHARSILSVLVHQLTNRFVLFQGASRESYGILQQPDKFLRRVPDNDELLVIHRYDIPEERLFYANGLKGELLKRAMRKVDAWVAFATTPCQEHGHTLRTRAGHCFVCKPEGLTYLRRHSAPAHVYLAVAHSTNIYKIGLSQEPNERVVRLSREGYGGHHDWRLVCSRYFGKAGQVEAMLHGLHEIERSNGQYLHSSEGLVEARELFELDEDSIEWLRDFFK